MPILPQSARGCFFHRVRIFVAFAATAYILPDVSIRVLS